jgi:hypothetical protein
MASGRRCVRWDAGYHIRANWLDRGKDKYVRQTHTTARCGLGADYGLNCGLWANYRVINNAAAVAYSPKLSPHTVARPQFRSSVG